jgi:hypothetical protein
MPSPQFSVPFSQSATWRHATFRGCNRVSRKVVPAKLRSADLQTIVGVSLPIISRLRQETGMSCFLDAKRSGRTCSPVSILKRSFAASTILDKMGKQSVTEQLSEMAMSALVPNSSNYQSVEGESTEDPCLQRGSFLFAIRLTTRLVSDIIKMFKRVK